MTEKKLIEIIKQKGYDADDLIDLFVLEQESNLNLMAYETNCDYIKNMFDSNYSNLYNNVNELYNVGLCDLKTKKTLHLLLSSNSYLAIKLFTEIINIIKSYVIDMPNNNNYILLNLVTNIESEILNIIFYCDEYRENIVSINNENKFKEKLHKYRIKRNNEL